MKKLRSSRANHIAVQSLFPFAAAPLLLLLAAATDEFGWTGGAYSGAKKCSG